MKVRDGWSWAADWTGFAVGVTIAGRGKGLRSLSVRKVDCFAVGVTIAGRGKGGQDSEDARDGEDGPDGNKKQDGNNGQDCDKRRLKP